MVLSSGADPSTEQQTKGADPRTGTLKGVLCRLPLGPSLSWLAVRGSLGFGFPGSPALSWRVPVCVFCSLSWPWVLSFFFFLFTGDVPSTVSFRWPWASRSSSPREGRRVNRVGADPRTGTGTDPSTSIFDVPLFARHPGVPLCGFLPLSPLLCARACVLASACTLYCYLIFQIVIRWRPSVALHVSCSRLLTGGCEPGAPFRRAWIVPGGSL